MPRQNVKQANGTSAASAPKKAPLATGDTPEGAQGTPGDVEASAPTGTAPGVGSVDVGGAVVGGVDAVGASQGVAQPAQATGEGVEATQEGETSGVEGRRGSAASNDIPSFFQACPHPPPPPRALFTGRNRPFTHLHKGNPFAATA